jgi:hypothetical protein
MIDSKSYWDSIKYFMYCRRCNNRFEVKKNEFHERVYCSIECLNDAWKQEDTDNGN